MKTMSAKWVIKLLFSRPTPRAGFLTLILFITMVGCAEKIPETDETIGSVRKFVLNENMIGELGRGSRKNACDYTEVLPQLLSQIGAEATIHPSENYYYFSFNRAGSLFSGSLRLSSDRRDDGEIDYVCYESYRSWITPGDEIRTYKRLTSANGVAVEKISPLSYSVKYGDAKTLFSLHKLDHKSPGAPLLEDDVRIGRTKDESGSAFELIYNSKINDFYFLLDVRMSVPYDFVRSSPNLVISRRTGFVYYHTETDKRYVLVAVNKREAQLNSYYDGPSDHLPENDYAKVGFWDYVYKAYPDMIGNHTPGGEVNEEGMVFSIMPYRLYENTTELGFVEDCTTNKKSEIDKIACMIWGI